MSRHAVLLMTIVVPLAVARPTAAHDLKVMVSRLVVDPGDTDTVYISHGHIIPVDAPIDAESLEDYSLKSPSGSVVYLRKEGTSLQVNEVPVEEKGVYQAVARRKPAIFSDVVDAKGAHHHHRGPKSSVTEGTVDHASRSHQFAKALLVSGAASDDPLPALGHELEIIPLGAPSTWRSGQDLRFEVRFQGKPLNGADVVATYLGFKPDQAWCYATSTDGKGVALVRPTQPGTWILRARTQRPAPLERREEYDIESYTATLVLEVRP